MITTILENACVEYYHVVFSIVANDFSTISTKFDSICTIGLGSTTNNKKRSFVKKLYIVVQYFCVQ